MDDKRAAAAFPTLFPESRWGSMAARLLSFDRARKTYEVLRESGGACRLPERLLEFIEVSYRATPDDLARLPRCGAGIVIANHPFGILEAAVLVTVLRRIRPDVRVLANELLSSIPELRELLIPIDVLGESKRTNVAGLREAIRFLAGGGLLLVFPAGSVSHFDWRALHSVDPPWSAGVCRLVAAAVRKGVNCGVTPVYIPGSNSALFHATGMIHADLRTALLAHELFNKRGACVELRVGRTVPPTRLLAMTTDAERIQYLRWRTELLAKRESFKARTSLPLRTSRTCAALEDGPAVEAIAADIARLPAAALLRKAGDLAVYLAGAAQIPSVLAEIGRLREITFRQAGEGTGNAVDLDRFDQRYKHLFVWNARKQEVVGAYRLAGTDETDDVYTKTLFQFDSRFLGKLGPALELGRSFIRREYQKGFAPLLLLWQGIGAFLAQNPRYKLLFGPVSISNQYQPASRELMLAFLDRWASLREWKGLVRARNAPPRPRADVLCRDIDDLSEVVADMEPAGTGVPVLLRQYLRLGGRLLGFTVDRQFSSSLDGLIVVDLTKTEPKLLARYLGKDEAARVLSFHERKKHERE